MEFDTLELVGDIGGVRSWLYTGTGIRDLWYLFGLSAGDELDDGGVVGILWWI